MLLHKRYELQNKTGGEKINDDNNTTTTFLKLNKWVCKSKIHQLLIPRVLIT